jgi:hypothetical protein
MRGRPKRDTSGYQPIKFEPEATHCRKCGQRLHFAYRSDRHVAFLTNRQEILYDVRQCPNPRCEGFDNRYVPQGVGAGVLKKYEYGLDVIAFIGQERLRKHATFPDLGATLRQTYGVPISDRRVQDLFDVYMALISTDITEDPARLAKLRAQGKILLGIDAAQPDMEAESLWIFRDTLSEEILLAFTSASADASLLPPYLKKIKTLRVPVTGVISDAQKIILSAVQEVFPGVPHQLCQLHFLKDFAKSVTAADQSLKVELGKNLRELSAFERAAAEKPSPALKKGDIKAPQSVTLTEDPPRPTPGRARTRVRLKPPKTREEGTLIRNVCEILRAILKNHGRYPLQTPGLETRDMLQKLHDALDEGIKKGELPLFSCANSPNMFTSP